MMSESAFPTDTRVRNEAYTLIEAGYKVSIIAIRKYENEKLQDIVNGVNVYRVPLLEVFDKDGKASSWIGKLLNKVKSTLGYLTEYFYFTAACFFISIYILFKDGFDAIHLHNPPNTIFVVGAFFRIFGKKFVFDHHDLTPELYLSRYKTDKDIVYRILMIEEKLCLRFANIVIATNESYKEIDIKRGDKNPDNIFIVRNGPNLETVYEVPKDQNLLDMNKSILIYIGVMGPQDGVDYLVRALAEVVYTFKRTDFHCVLVGRGDAIPGLKALAKKLNIEQYLHFTGPDRIPQEDLLRYLSTADIGLDPSPSSPLNDASTWIKVMEYMALGKPIVSFDLKETHFTAQDAAVYVTPNNEKEYAQAVIDLMDDPAKRKKLGEFGRKRILDELSWQHVSKNLVKAYETLFSA